MSSYSEGQTHQLADKFEAEGFTPAEITQLGQFKNLAGIKAVLNGQAKITPVGEDATRVITINETTIVVNLGATPKRPFRGAEVDQHSGKGWVIVEKRADGLYVDGRKVILHLSKRQCGDKWLRGHELRKELMGKPVLNANLLDALYRNTHLTPEDWKGRYVFFWGTIYRGSGGLYVRYLCFFGVGGWRSEYGWLGGDGFGGRGPAVLRESN